MNKFILLFVLVSLSQASEFLPKDLGMNLPQCFADVSSLKTEIQAFLASGSISMETLLAEYENKLKPIFASLKTDCLFGLEATENLGTNWVACIGDFASLAPTIADLVQNIIAKNLPGCIGDLTKILGEIQPILKDCFSAQ